MSIFISQFLDCVSAAGLLRDPGADAALLVLLKDSL